MISNRQQWQFSNVYRLANTVAHRLARMAFGHRGEYVVE